MPYNWGWQSFNKPKIELLQQYRLHDRTKVYSTCYIIKTITTVKKFILTPKVTKDDRFSDKGSWWTAESRFCLLADLESGFLVSARIVVLCRQLCRLNNLHLGRFHNSHLRSGKILKMLRRRKKTVTVDELRNQLLFAMPLGLPSSFGQETPYWWMLLRPP